MDAALLALLACPQCRGTLREPGGKKVALACGACGLEFPRLGEVLCLYRDPGRQLGDWRRQAQRFVELSAGSVEAMDEQGKRDDLLPATRGRLQRLRDANAKNAERLVQLLSEAGLPPDSKAKASGSAFTLIEYYTHVLRDWVWDQDGGGENGRAAELVTSALGEAKSVGRVLVLGAGPCRLAYDLHMALGAELTVALDINPLLLLAAARTLFGKPWSLYEFPPEPRDLASVAVDHELRAPRGRPERFHLLLADAFAPPLRPGSFDTVVTPWFIDIVPVDVRQSLALIHGLLAPGGRWLNFGPLAYERERAPYQRYTPEELAELAGLAGFELGPPRRERLEFLRSPWSGGARTEEVLAFAARKREPAPPADLDPPAWLMLPHLPIPRFAGLDGYQPEHPMLGYLAAQIDGRTTLEDLAARMIRDHGARQETALEGTRAALMLLRQTVRKDG
jgi:hypothetical protein